MRIVAILANALLLVLTLLLLLGNGFEMESSEVPLVLTMLVAPILSIVALLLRGACSKDWLARYFERRAFEERQKFNALRPRLAQQDATPKAGLATPASHSGVTEGPPSVS